MSEEYWLISVPGRTSPRQRYDEVCRATGRDQLSQNYLFQIPDLKVRRRRNGAQSRRSNFARLGRNIGFFSLSVRWFRSSRYVHRRVKETLLSLSSVDPFVFDQCDEEIDSILLQRYFGRRSKSFSRKFTHRLRIAFVESLFSFFSSRKCFD